MFSSASKKQRPKIESKPQPRRIQKPLIDGKGKSPAKKNASYAFGARAAPKRKRDVICIAYDPDGEGGEAWTMDEEGNHGKRRATEEDIIAEQRKRFRQEMDNHSRDVYFWNKDKTFRVWLMTKREVDEQFITPAYHEMGLPEHAYKNNNPKDPANDNKAWLTVAQTKELWSLYGKARAVSKMTFKWSIQELESRKYEKYDEYAEQVRACLPKGPSMHELMQQGRPDMYLMLNTLTYTVDRTREIPYYKRLSFIGCCTDWYGRQVSLVLREFLPYMYTRIPLAYTKRVRHKIRDRLKEDPSLGTEEELCQIEFTKYAQVLVNALERELMLWTQRRAHSGEYNANKNNEDEEDSNPYEEDSSNGFGRNASTNSNRDEQIDKKGSKNVTDLCWLVPPLITKKRNRDEDGDYGMYDEDGDTLAYEDEFYRPGQDDDGGYMQSSSATTYQWRQKKDLYGRAYHQNFKEQMLKRGSLIRKWQVHTSTHKTALGYAARRKETFIQMHVAHPCLIPVLRDFLWDPDNMMQSPPLLERDGPFTEEGMGPTDGRKCWAVYEAKILFPTRYVIDQFMTFSGWNKLAKGQYNFVPDSRRQTTCDMEIECRYDVPKTIHANPALAAEADYVAPEPVLVGSIPGWENSDFAKSGKTLQNTLAPKIFTSEDGEMCELGDLREVQPDGKPVGFYRKPTVKKQNGPIQKLGESMNVDPEEQRIYDLFMKAFETGDVELMKEYEEAMLKRGMEMSLKPDKFPDPRISSITKWAVIVYNYLKLGEPHKFIFSVGELDLEAAKKIPELIGATILCYPTEKAMLEALVIFIHKMRMQKRLTYNGDGFDFPYLLARCKILGIPMAQHCGIIINKPTYFTNRTVRGRNRTDMKMEGIQTSDFLKYSQKQPAKPFKGRSYALGAVSQRILGITKIDFGHSWIEEAQKYLASRTMLAAYCLRDAMLPMLCMFKQATHLSDVEYSRLLSTQGQELQDSGSMLGLLNLFMSFRNALSVRNYGVYMLFPTMLPPKSDDEEEEEDFFAAGTTDGVNPDDDDGGEDSDDEEADSDDDDGKDSDDEESSSSKQKKTLASFFGKNSTITPSPSTTSSGRTAVKPAKKKAKYKGGLVLHVRDDSKMINSKFKEMQLIAKNFYIWMLILEDFNSLYPSIMEDWNTCLTTYVADQKVRQKMKRGEDFVCYENVKLVEQPADPIENDYDFHQIDDLEKERRRELRDVFRRRKLEIIPMTEEEELTRPGFVKRDKMVGIFPTAESILKRRRKIVQGQMKVVEARMELITGYGEVTGLKLALPLFKQLHEKRKPDGSINIDLVPKGYLGLMDIVDRLIDEICPRLFNLNGCNDNEETKNMFYDAWQAWKTVIPEYDVDLIDWLNGKSMEDRERMQKVFAFILPFGLEELERLQNEWIQLNVLQLSLKTTGNALYGGAGSKWSPFKLIALAETVTKCGQHLNMLVVDHIENTYVPSITNPYLLAVIYGDTDSTGSLACHYHLPKLQFAKKQDEIDDANRLGWQIKKTANERIKKDLNTVVQNLDLEKVVERAEIDNNKKYAGLYHYVGGRHSFEMKGLAGVRADTSPFIADGQKKMLIKIVEEGKYEEAEEFVIQQLAKIHYHQVSNCLISENKSFSRDPELYTNKQKHVCINNRHQKINKQLIQAGLPPTALPPKRAGDRMHVMALELKEFAGTPYYEAAKHSKCERYEELLYAARLWKKYCSKTYMEAAWSSWGRLLWRPSPYKTEKELKEHIFNDPRLKGTGRISKHVIAEYDDHLARRRNEIVESITSDKMAAMGEQVVGRVKRAGFGDKSIIDMYFAPVSDKKCRLCRIDVDPVRRPYENSGSIVVCHECMEERKDLEYLYEIGQELKMWLDMAKQLWMTCANCQVDMKMVEIEEAPKKLIGNDGGNGGGTSSSSSSTKKEPARKLTPKNAVKIESLARGCSQRDCNTLFDHLNVQYYLGLNRFELEKWGICEEDNMYASSGEVLFKTANLVREAQQFVPAAYLLKNFVHSDK